MPRRYLLLVGLVFFCGVISHSSPSYAMRADGDVAPFGNRDGIVNVGDALVCLRIALNLETPTCMDSVHADVAPIGGDGQPEPDGVVNVGDALVILRKAVGLATFDGLASDPNFDGDCDGYTASAGDCNDDDVSIYPGATEICGDTLDNDCDNETDEIECVSPPSSNLPSTGQTSCYDTPGNVINCTDSGQDGDLIINPMSFSDNGNNTVTDNVTGLLWQQSSDGTGRFFDDAVSYCNDLTLADLSNWRLPNRRELMNIIDYGMYNPAINSSYFPDSNLPYWTNTPAATLTSTPYAWATSFYNGAVYLYDRAYYSYHARCVSGPEHTTSFTENGDGTVTDQDTSLMWQQTDDNTARTWQSAIDYCNDLVLPPGGHSDWRLPDIKELESIVDFSVYNPAIDTAFTGTNTSVYWSSTTNFSIPVRAWVVNFYNGYVSETHYKTESAHLYVRCVR